MASGLKEKDRGLDALIRHAAKEDGAAVVVGVLDPDIAPRAVMNEFGTRHIPARPFLRPTMDDNRTKYGRMARKGASRILAGKSTSDDELELIGRVMAEDIRSRVITTRTPPNHPSTIREKGSNNPLIDTGAMLNAITHEVRGVGE